MITQLNVRSKDEWLLGHIQQETLLIMKNIDFIIWKKIYGGLLSKLRVRLDTTENWKLKIETENWKIL